MGISRLRLATMCAAVGALAVACLYDVPDVGSDGGDGGPDADGGLDGSLPDGAAPDAGPLVPGTLISTAHVCSGAIGSIAASAGQVMVACTEGSQWNPSAFSSPRGSLQIFLADGGAASASTRYSNLNNTRFLVATGASFLTEANGSRYGPVADLEAAGGMRTFACYDGTAGAVTTVDGFLYLSGTGGDSLAFGNGVFRGSVADICTFSSGQCKDSTCSMVRLGRLPDGHPSGGVAVVGGALFTYVCAEPTARVFSFPRDGTASNLPPPPPIYDSTNDPNPALPDAADPDAAPPPSTCSDGAPPGLAALGQSLFFGVDQRVKTCQPGGGCSTAWTETGPVRVVTSDGAVLYWAVGGEVRHTKGIATAPTTYYEAPNQVTAMAAGNGQPNVYLGTSTGDVLTVR